MRYSAAIDLGGTNIGIGIVSEEGELVHKTSVPVEGIDNSDVLLAQIGDSVKLAAEEAGMELTSLSFVGIGIPGICKGEKGPVVYAPNLFWNNVDVVTPIEKATGLPVFLGNDADCAALGEYNFGEGKNYKTMLLLTLGTGVGGAIVSEGKLFKGFGDYSGEFGHFPVVHGGAHCNCGKCGCFEVYGSANALKRQTVEATMANPQSLMYEMMEGKPENVSGRTPFLAAEQGDETAIAVVDQYISYLADGISGLINIFRPDVVMLGGGVANQGATLIDPLDAKVQKLCYCHENVPVPHVMKASLGNKAGIIGAGMLGF